MRNLISSIRDLESTGKVDNDMKPFTVLKQYLTGTITYTMAMKELQKYDSGAYTKLVRGLINKHKLIERRDSP